jgi:predicted dehydrogenase
MGENDLRAAVVGVGMIGSLHARAYQDDPRTTLAAVMDDSAERAREVGADLGVPWYAEVSEMLGREEIDVVSVATPEQHRYAPAVACARAGKHLLLEKPLAPTLAEVDRLIEEVEATGVTTMVNFILRSEPRYVRAKGAMADGTVGEPCTIFARRRGTSLGAEVYGPWTDLLISTAIHDLDIMVWLNDCEVERVYAEGVAKRSAEWGREDAIAAVIRFTNGAVGLLETSWVLPPTVPAPLDASLQVVGTGGGIFIEGASYGLAVVDSEGYKLPDLAHWPVGRDGVEGALRASINAFITSVMTGEAPVMTLREARYAQEVVDALKLSTERGAPVSLPLTVQGDWHDT